MSPERYLLERVMNMIDYRHAPSEAMALTREIQELLAQPEQEPDYEDGPEFKGWDKRSGTQEPVAWITEWEQKQVSTSIFKDQTLRRVSFTKSNAPSAVLNHIPLYTAPKKREPLSNTEVEQTTKNMSEFGADMFKAGIAAAERAHGIGEN